MTSSLPPDAEQWAAALRLYDEPHGDEYFVIDPTGRFPVWYRLDGSVFSDTHGQDVRSRELVVWAIERRGWTNDKLYKVAKGRGNSD